MTPLFSADALLRAVGGVMTQKFDVRGISIDTRSLQPGDLFIALVTESGDGHAFVADALARGAAGALVHRRDALPTDAPLLVVTDTLVALTELGAFARARFQGRVVAVTGSVGKTTTKEVLRVVLSASGRTHAAQASFNNHWGVPLTLARMPEDFDFSVIEIGMNHPGEIAPLARLAKPDVAIITTIAATHIGHMGSLEAIAEEKASIVEGLQPQGMLVLPEDAPMFYVLTSHEARTQRCTFGSRNILDIAETSEASDVLADIDGTHVRFHLNVPGRHIVMNALSALTAARAMGLDLERSAAALVDFQPLSGRGLRRPILHGQAILLDESYNASGASMRAALSVLRMMPARRRIAVLGDMLELGEFSKDEHTALAQPVRDSADLLYTCGPWMKFLHDTIDTGRRGVHASDSTQLAPILLADLREGDAVLVKGSLGSAMNVIVRALEMERV